jgi:D-aspartate ligase
VPSATTIGGMATNRKAVLMNAGTVKAIVFLCYVNGLAIIRSLGRRGVPVVAVDYNKESLGFSSKYTSESIIAPDPKVDREEFLSFLFEKSSEWAGSVLIPTHDDELIIFSSHKEELSKYYIVPVPDWETTKKIVDKERTYEIAERLNIPIPKMISLDSVKSLDSLQGEIGYPCLLKPRRGHEFSPKFKRKAFIIEDSEQLRARATLASQAGCDMLIQELIHGADNQLYAYIAYYDKESKPLAEFTGRKLRQSPPFIGVARVAESTLTEEIITPSRRILKELSFVGLCALEYKKDNSDGKFKLLEINGRSFLWMGLPMKCGVDFPWIMYNDLVWRKTLRVSGYRIGVKWIHETVDMLMTILHPRQSKLLSREYFSTYFAPKTLAVFASDDWKPTIKEWYIIILLASRKLGHLWSMFRGKILRLTWHRPLEKTADNRH